MRHTLIALTSAALVCLSSAAVSAFPNEPVRVVVPFAAGGGSDTFVRVIQEGIGRAKLLPQPIVVVNVPGAGGAVGSRRVKDAEPDGYEILFNHVAILSSQASGRLDFGYRDFEPIAGTGRICTIPMVREDSNYGTLKDLLEVAKANPDSVLAGVNMGGLNHTAGLILQAAEPGAEFRFVQIGGGAKNFAAIEGGHVEVGFFTGSEAVIYEQQGLRPLAILAPERDPNLPSLPTAHELGYDAELCTINMWFAPKGTPEEATETLADALEQATQTEFVRTKLEEFKYTPTFIRGEKLQDYLDQEYAKLEAALKHGS